MKLSFECVKTNIDWLKISFSTLFILIYNGCNFIANKIKYNNILWSIYGLFIIIFNIFLKPVYFVTQQVYEACKCLE